MRKIGLMVSVLLGLIGTVVYFMTIPTVDEEALVNVVVEAGDEQVLDNIYFNGYIYDYSDFHVSNDKVHTTEGLSYLDKIDAPPHMNLQLLHQSYPEFVEALSHDYRIFSNHLVYSENYLTSAHFEITEGDYRIETEKVYLNVLDKEAEEVQTDVIDRSNELNGDSVEIIGLYETYPTVKMLLSVSSWPNNYSESTSQILLGEYNIETKTYSEEKLFEKQGSFYSDLVAQNKSSVLINHHSATEQGTYLFNFDESILSPLESEGKVFLLDEESDLFALASVDGETVLQFFERNAEENLEVTEEVPLAIDFDLMLNQQAFPLIEAALINDYLYVVQSKENFEDTGEVLPATMQVFNPTNGESVMSGYIGFNEKNEVNAYSGMVESIGQLSDF